jgi:hypothetical protein
VILGLRVFAFFLVIFCSPNILQPTSRNNDRCAQERDDWVRNALIKMDSIRSGMTREQLAKVFTMQGGLSNGLRRTFVSRDCSYFKVDVEFKAVGRPDHDNGGRVTTIEDPRDIIVRISQPYLAFGVTD